MQLAISIPNGKPSAVDRTVSMKSIAVALLVTLVAFVTPALSQRASSPPQRFYDSNGQFRGNAWCLRNNGFSGGGSMRCDYLTFEQCRTNIGTANDCVRNPFSYPPGQYGVNAPLWSLPAR